MLTPVYRELQYWIQEGTGAHIPKKKTLPFLVQYVHYITEEGEEKQKLYFVPSSVKQKIGTNNNSLN